MDLDSERRKQESADIRKAFREMFPLASEHDLPWAASHIKDFLRDRIAREVIEGTSHFTSRVVRILCEVSPPKTHVEDMARIVVEQAKMVTEGRRKLEAAAEATAERDEMLARLSEIGRIVGCNHVTDPDGRQKLVSCVRETVEAADAAKPPGIKNVPSWIEQALGVDGAHHKQFYLQKLATVFGVQASEMEPGIAP